MGTPRIERGTFRILEGVNFFFSLLLSQLSYVPDEEVSHKDLQKSTRSLRIEAGTKLKRAHADHSITVL